jgi:hypothetical protein
MIQPNQASALVSVVSAGAASPDELEIMLEDAPSVARRSPDGWQYVITRLDLSGAVLDGSLRPEVASPSDAVRWCLT